MSVCTSPSDEALVRRLVELTEARLPLVADPWAWLATELGLEVDDTLALLQRLQAEGRSAGSPRCPTTTGWVTGTTA